MYSTDYQKMAYRLTDARQARAVVKSGFLEFHFQRYLPICSQHTTRKPTQNTTEKNFRPFYNAISMTVSQRVNSFSLRGDTLKKKSSAMWYLVECCVNIVTMYLIYRDISGKFESTRRGKMKVHVCDHRIVPEAVKSGGTTVVEYCR
jgi:hypothetical protein